MTYIITRTDLATNETVEIARIASPISALNYCSLKMERQLLAESQGEMYDCTYDIKDSNNKPFNILNHLRSGSKVLYLAYARYSEASVIYL